MSHPSSDEDVEVDLGAEQSEEDPSAASGLNLSLQQLMFSIYAPTLFQAISDGIAIPLIPIMVHQIFDGTGGMVGAAVAVVGVGKIGANIPAGRFIAARGMRHSMLAALQIALASFALAAVAPSVGVLLLSQVARGCGFSLWTLSRQTFIAANVASDRRGRAMAGIGGMSRVSKFLGPVLGGTVAAHVSIRAAMWLAAACEVGAIVCVARWLPAGCDGPDGPGGLGGAGHARSENGGRGGGESAEQHAEKRSCWGIFRVHWRDLLVFGFFVFCLMAVRDARNVLHPLQALVGLSIGNDGVGHVVAISYFADMALFPAAGFVMDRFGRKVAAVPSLALQALSFALLPSTGDEASLMAVGALCGAGNGISSGLLMTIGSDLAPPDMRSQFLGLYRTFSDCGSLLGPLVVGMVAEHGGLTASAWVACGIGAVGAVWMACVARETLASKTQQRSAPLQRLPGVGGTNKSGGSVRGSTGMRTKMTQLKALAKRAVNSSQGDTGRTKYDALPHLSGTAVAVV